MTNEDRLKAMRWAAATRLALRKGDRPERHRDLSTVNLINRELAFAALGMSTRDASGIALAVEMQMAFEKLSGLGPKETAADDGK
jgi:hypothetical protein